MSQPPYPGQPYPDEPNPGQQPGYQPPGPPPYGPPPGQPSYGPPSYGSPSEPSYEPPAYGQPASGPPSYPPTAYQPPGPEPTYAQAGYGPQSYPQQGYQPAPGQPGYPPMGAPTPPRKSRVVPIVLTSLAVVLVLCIGGGVAVFLAARNSVNDAADSSEYVVPSTAPTRGASPSPTPAAKTIRVVEPKTLGGREKLTDPQFAGIADQLRSDLGDVPGATDSVGALYGDPADQDIVVIAAVEAPVANPKQELNGTFLGAGISGLKVTGITDVAPGPLGGAAKCGNSTTEGVDLIMCAWADDGSIGWIIWYFESMKNVKAEFAKLRGQVEKAS